MKTINLNTLLKFLIKLIQRFLQDGCLYRAASLTVTTLIALVPLTTLILGLLSLIPFTHSLGTPIQAFVFNNFMPKAGEVIQTYLEHFVQQTQQLSYIGGVGLGISALFLILTIEQTFNHIWRTEDYHFHKYSGAFIHWSLLILLPFLIAGTISFMILIYSLPLVTKTIHFLHVQSMLFYLLPFLVSWLGFAALYLLLPKTKVYLSYALFSGFVSAILLNISKWGFSLYLNYFPFYQTVYGALYVFPLFLIWVQLAWIIVLLGAELCYSLHYPSDRKFKFSPFNVPTKY